MKYFAIIILLILLISGCNNYFAALKIKNNYSKAYNGLDTLIRTDGYYYEECFPDVCEPTVFLSDGSFYVSGVRYTFITDIDEKIRKYGCYKNGHFINKGDTLVAFSVFEYQPMCFDLYTNYYLIDDSITLRMVKAVYNNGQMIRTTNFNAIYKFRHFPNIEQYIKK